MPDQGFDSLKMKLTNEANVTTHNIAPLRITPVLDTSYYSSWAAHAFISWIVHAIYILSSDNFQLASLSKPWSQALIPFMQENNGEATY